MREPLSVARIKMQRQTNPPTQLPLDTNTRVAPIQYWDRISVPITSKQLDRIIRLIRGANPLTASHLNHQSRLFYTWKMKPLENSTRDQGCMSTSFNINTRHQRTHTQKKSTQTLATALSILDHCFSFKNRFRIKDEQSNNYIAPKL